MTMTSFVPDPIKLEVYKNLLADVAEEMGAVLGRTGFSPNIKERRDYSCGVFDGQGRLVAQALHIPVHLGSMPLSVAAAMEDIQWQPGDVVLLNHPFRGGTHLPDLTMVAPVYLEGNDQPFLFLANRAHHADIGGMSPGSMPIAEELYQEGLIIPPIKLMEAGRAVPGIRELILANVRTPEERAGDLSAQLAALEVGRRRMLQIVHDQGASEVALYLEALLDYAERVTREAVRSIPDGQYFFEDQLDNDGLSPEPVPIRVCLTVRDDRVAVDFTGSAPQTRGSVNAVRAITLSAVFYVIRCLLDENIPTNAGCLRPITLIAPEGSVVNARFPAAVAGGNVETSQRLVDVLLGALAQALPERIPAASSGTMNNLTIGGTNHGTGKRFAYYETTGGGMGAGPDGPGLSGVHTHMTNTRNTPVEALEHAYPLQVVSYKLRKNSGGAGRHQGGNGLVREIKALTEVSVTILSDRRGQGPYGLAGGRAGRPGRNSLIDGGHEQELGGKVRLTLKAGQAVRLETPGGGGWGQTKD